MYAFNKQFSWPNSKILMKCKFLWLCLENVIHGLRYLCVSVLLCAMEASQPLLLCSFCAFTAPLVQQTDGGTSVPLNELISLLLKTFLSPDALPLKVLVERGRIGGWSNGLNKDWVSGKICSVPNSAAHLPKQLGQVTNPFNLFLEMGIMLHGQADDEISVLFSSSFYQGRALPCLLKPIPWVLKGIIWCGGWTL